MLSLHNRGSGLFAGAGPFVQATGSRAACTRRPPRTLHNKNKPGRFRPATRGLERSLHAHGHNQVDACVRNGVARSQRLWKASFRPHGACLPVRPLARSSSETVEPRLWLLRPHHPTRRLAIHPVVQCHRHLCLRLRPRLCIERVLPRRCVLRVACVPTAWLTNASDASCPFPRPIAHPAGPFDSSCPASGGAREAAMRVGRGGGRKSGRERRPASGTAYRENVERKRRRTRACGRNVAEKRHNRGITVAERERMRWNSAEHRHKLGRTAAGWRNNGITMAE